MKPVPVSSCTCAKARRAARALTRIYDRHLRQSGLNISQYSLMTHIRRLAPTNVSDLARAVRLDRTTLVRNLANLEDRGYVRDAAAAGSRDRELSLSPEGEQVVETAAELWRAAQREVEEALGKNDLEQFTRLLHAVENLG